MIQPTRAIVATATGTLDAGTGQLFSLHILAGADAATAIVRTGGSGGTVIAAVGAAAGVGSSHTFNGGVPYINLHVTVTGTTPQVVAEVG